MSRKDRHQSTENNETQEPWEQPIYDTEDEASSRSTQRQQKKGNTLFLSLFLILLGLCIAIPAGAYFWIRNGSSNSATAASSSSTTSSIVESSTVESTVESTTVSSEPTSDTQSVAGETTPTSAVTPETTPSSTVTEPEQTTPSSVAPQETTPTSTPEAGAGVSGSTTVVQAGEGPRQVAERAGITVDQLFQLNGIDPNNYMLYPGQELRVQ